MIIELIIALLVGITIGTITGLLPGIHNNLVAVFLLSLSPFLLAITSPQALVVFIVALAITNCFVDFIPSILLGAPDEDTNLSVLPGHKLLLEGYGYVAIVLTVYGGMLSLLILIFLIPVFIGILPIIYPYILRVMSLILILISSFLILTEKKNRKLWAGIIFLFSGFLGIATLNLSLKEPLLPLFSGLFGAGGLILSIKNKIQLPPQKIFQLKQIKIPKKSFLKATFAASIASPFTAFLPGLGSSQAATIGSEITGELDEREFLFAIGAINSLVMSLSFIAFYSINKTRTGAALAVSELISSPVKSDLIIMITAIIFSSILAGIITLWIGKVMSRSIMKINYSLISFIILIILTVLTAIFSGFLGLIVFITSAALGIVAIELNVKRTNLMGCLLIPTILFYLL